MLFFFLFLSLLHWIDFSTAHARTRMQAGCEINKEKKKKRKICIAVVVIIIIGNVSRNCTHGTASCWIEFRLFLRTQCFFSPHKLLLLLQAACSFGYMCTAAAILPKKRSASNYPQGRTGREKIVIDN